MLEGWDLGFLACVGVVIFTSGVVVWLHWLWRQSVVRKEEIKRLLVLASEETARAELEATAEYGYGSRYGYDSVAVAEVEVEAEEPVEVEEEEEAAQAAADVSRRLEYQCEVCFSPTTTRCKQCKAVHYCSGKCQIIHWRQGHKDECQPFAISEQSDDMGDSSRQNLLKPIENRIHSGSAKVEGRNPAKPVEISSGKQGFSDYNFAKLPNLKDDVEVEHLTDKKESTSNARVVSPSISNKHPGVIALGVSSGNASAIYVNNSNILDGHQPVYLVPKKIKGDHANKIKPSLSQHPIFVDPAENIASPLKGKVIKPSSVDVDACYGSSTSSGSSIDGCNESSFSESSTSSSGFWEGTVKLCRARGSVNDTSPSCSDEARDVDLLDGETSPYYYSEMARTVPSGLDKSGSHAKKVLSDDQHPPFSDINRPRSLLASSVEVNKAGLVARRSSLSYEKADDFSSRKVSTSGEAREPALCRDAKGSSFSSPSTEKSKSQVAGTLGIFQEKKPIERNYLTSKSSDEHLSSSIVKHNVETLKPVEIDSTHLPSTRSSDFHCQSLNARNSSKASVWKVVDHIKASKFARFNSLGAASDSVGRYSNKGLFPYELFVKLYNWNKVELHPCGLVNCGNSCYANVVLQCLTFTPPLSAYFLQGLHSKGGCKKRYWCFACEFEGLVLKAHQGNSPLSPSRILSNLQNIGSHLANGREEDAHEFLRYVIDTMQSLCLKEAGVSSSGSFEEETTLIGLTFGGYLRSKIECMRCGGKSERHEKMMDLTVEIGGDIGTLEEALRQFTHTETLDGENKYHCSRCKSYEKARKKLRVLEAPNILTIALKRFQSGRFGKLNKTIKFPEILDLAPYMSGTSDKSPVYRLYGVVVHLDLMNAAFSGHYVCYVKNAQNKWFKLDDSSVKAVELEKVLSKDAYMLLYARCSPRAPRVLRSSLNSRDIRKSKHFDCKTRYSPRGPLDVPVRDSSNGRNYNESAYPSYSTFQPIRRILEDDSSSENSSSFFSEGNSCSTDSSNRDSTSTDDYFDQIFAEVGWNSPSPWRNSSDSETSSSSSSPSPMYFRHSDSDHYAARYSETGISCTDAADSERRGGNHFLCPDSTKHCRKLDGSSSCKESSSSKLERANPFDNVKSSLSFRNR